MPLLNLPEQNTHQNLNSNQGDANSFIANQTGGVNLQSPIANVQNNQPLPNAPEPVNLNTQQDLTDHVHQNIQRSIEATKPDDNLGVQPQADIQSNLQDFSIDALLLQAMQKKASDIHLSVNNKALLRIDGELVAMNTNILNDSLMVSYVNHLIANRTNVKLESLFQYDMGYDLNNSRFRINIFKQQGHFTIVARLIPSEIKSVDELGLPTVLKEFGNVSGGLVLVTGPTGSGKSTTLAAVINHINQNYSKHIITIEDPIEFIFPKAACLINQREHGQDFESWPAALKSILRQDPDIVFVGEMRDLETISAAITLSETGHLVFATLHTNSASQTMDRIIDVFPEGQQSQIRAQLSNVITAVIAQRLVPLIQGGRKASMEIMLANPAIRNTIREGNTHQIDNMIQTGQDQGMISMSRSLIELINQGLLNPEVARSFAPNLEEFNSLLNSLN